MRIDWLVILLGLLAGTYLVRAVPFWWDRIDHLPPPLKRFLELVPAAALGALILPDVLGAAEVWIALATITVSFGLALLGVQLTVVVLITVLGSWAALGLL